jgi:hypothetical protein
MARGGARPGAGRKAGKSANTSPLSRARARGGGSENQRPWPADKVERWAIDRLIPYAKNARTHTDAQVAAIAARREPKVATAHSRRRSMAAPEHPVSQTGDLWLLGRHRLLCGDSTVATDVERVLGGVEPHLMVTDPPYGVDYDPAWRNKAKFSDGKNHRGRAVGNVRNALGPDMAAARRLDQLRGQADAVAGLAQAPFEDIAHAEIAADLFHVDRPALVDEGCHRRARCVRGGWSK